MSSDRTTEILNYLSAISREVGEMPTELREANVRLGRLEVETRAVVPRLDHIESVVLQTRAEELQNRADSRDLEDRVAGLESKRS